MDQNRSTPGHNPREVVEQAILNYAFIADPDKNPYPFPLSIPQALVRTPIASLRAIVASHLEEEGIIVKQREIRFWRTNAPLESEVAVNGWHKWLATVTSNGENLFMAMPLTSTLSSCLKERLQDDSLLHLLIAEGPELNVKLPMPAAVPPPLQPTTARIVAHGEYYVGYYEGRESWKSVTEAEWHSKVIRIPNNLMTPAILLGLRYLDTGSGYFHSPTTSNDEIQLTSHVSEVYPDNFRIHLNSFGKTLLYQGLLSWMAICPQNPLTPPDYEPLQWGVADSQNTNPRKIGRRSTTQRINFRQGYERPPCVFSCLSGFTIGASGGTHWDIGTSVTGIDREGFTLHIEKTRDSGLHMNGVVGHAQVSWLAFPNEPDSSRKMMCGEFSLKDGVPLPGRNDIVWRGRVRLMKGFTSPPQIFVAFKSFDANKSANVRLELDVDKVTTEWMEWRVRKWHDTTIYGANMAFVAVGIPK